MTPELKSLIIVSLSLGITGLIIFAISMFFRKAS